MTTTCLIGAGAGAKALARGAAPSPTTSAAKPQLNLGRNRMRHASSKPRGPKDPEGPFVSCPWSGWLASCGSEPTLSPTNAKEQLRQAELVAGDRSQKGNAPLTIA